MKRKGTPDSKHVVTGNWMHTHGDVREYTCSCGVEWVETNEPPEHAAKRKEAPDAE